MYRYLPPATQVVLISATLPHEILEMTNKFMTDPIRILVKRLVTSVIGASLSCTGFKRDHTFFRSELELEACLSFIATFPDAFLLSNLFSV